MKYAIDMQRRYSPERITPLNKLQMNWAIVMLPISVVLLNVGVDVAQVIGVKIHTYKPFVFM
jgi:hypothetical protein